MRVDLLLTLWLGMPVWVWLAFIGAVLVLLALDLGVLNRGGKEISTSKSLKLSAFYIALGLAWAIAVFYIYLTYADAGAIDPQIAAAGTPEERAWTAVTLYITGYLVEKTLAMDNVFVISMIFAYFAVPRAYQHRVLFWGILGVLVLRALMIGLGAALVMQFSWVMYFFAVILVATGIKMLVMADKEPEIGNNPVLRFLKARMRVTETLHGNAFTVRQPDPRTGRMVLWATPLFLCLILVEIADLIFAIDSVPAIFAITPDPFIVYTSNIFAILGLRALYFALAAMVHRFHYLKYALSLVLVFIGTKIVLGDLVWGGKVPAELSLGVTVTLLAGGVIYSLWKTRGAPAAPAPAAAVPATTGLAVAEVMARDVRTVSLGAPISEAMDAMVETGASAVPVIDAAGRLIGVVTEADLLRRFEFGNVRDVPAWRRLVTDDRTLARDVAKAHGRRVEEVMTRDPVTVQLTASVADAALLLFERGFKRVPVLDGDRLAGMLDRGEVLRALARLGREMRAGAASDEEIIASLQHRIARAGFVSLQQLEVSAASGVVAIAGVVTSVEQRLALLALAESEAGVIAVHDNLMVVAGMVAQDAAHTRLETEPGLPRGAAPAGGLG
jgi:tellurite resistance protein TerC